MKHIQKVFLCILILCILFGCSKANENEKITVYEPTCTNNGYTLHENGSTITIDNEVPALGHDFGEWIEENDTRYRICERCHEKEVESNSILDVPNVYLDGSFDGMNKNDRVILDFKFDSKNMSFSCYSSTSWQGHSTLNLPKKNYTIRLYDDYALDNKHKLIFKDWNNEHKYILKANYYDSTYSRNLIASEIWAQIVEARNNLPNELVYSSNYGSIDGFLVNLYINGDFAGIYNMNIHKDDDLYYMNEGLNHTIVIANAQTKEESLFKANTTFDDNSDWELEFCGANEYEWAQKSFNELISFVMNSDDDSFKNNLNKYLDVDSAIDYLLFIYLLNLPKSVAKDFVLINYGNQWIASAYDMDKAFGLNDDGTGFISNTEFVPTKFENGLWDSKTNSLLWDRLLNSYFDSISKRYVELRKGPLSDDNIYKIIEDKIGRITKDMLKDEESLYPKRISFEDGVKQINECVDTRLDILDELFQMEVE